MEVQNLEKFNKGVRYLLNVIDIYTRFLWVESLEDKEQQTVLDGFNKIIRSLDQKLLYVCTDLGAEFVNHLFRQYCHNEGIIQINPFSHGKAVYIED